MSKINFFLRLGRAVGQLFNVRSGQAYQLGDAVPIYDTNPNARNSQARPVATAVCVKRYADDPRYLQRPFSDPRRHGPALPDLNTGQDCYQFEIKE
jgi:hypothetical protein